jgi:SAM-dependent methyltransferase
MLDNALDKAKDKLKDRTKASSNIIDLKSHHGGRESDSFHADDVDPMAPEIITNPLLKNIPATIIKRAWFTMAHLVLEDDSRVLDIRCQSGIGTYAMAALNPTINFIGIDRNTTLIDEAEKKYKLPNLTFMSGDIQENFVPKGTLDAIVNSFTLHEIYSENNCSERAVTVLLERQFDLLKQNGILFVQGHITPPEDEFVLIEMTEEFASKGDDIHTMSDIALLQLYAEQARPRKNDNCHGFYLEELPPRFPRTRLFRLPAKWAHEFILRKDDRENWNTELHKEYSFFTRNDFDRLIRNHGARLLYSAPHWDDALIKNRFDKKLRLFDQNGSPQEPSETSFVLVAQKAAERQSLILQERRPGKADNPNLRITAMRNEIDGTVMDVVSRDMHITEILPYRITDDGKLHVFVHEALPRPLLNTIPRKGANIDRKEWSGHMTEAFAVPQEIIETIDFDHFRSTLNFTQNYLGLKPEMGHLMEQGPGFYPAPDCIDERIETKFLNVTAPTDIIEPKIIPEDADGFSTKGRIREIDAQQILNAIGVGFIPTSRLELQILALYEKLRLDYQAWADCPLTLQTEEPEDVTKLQEIIANLAADDNRYKETKGTAGDLKSMQSVFVDEGQDDGGITGLASRDMDFILQEGSSMNTAIVLPLTRKINGEVMAGIVEQYLPVPQRYKGNGYIVSCPSFNLPSEITNFEMARKYIAEKFEVPLECVARMGESYFSHAGVTPQRIYPFAVSTGGASGWKKVGRAHGVTSYTPLYRLYRLLYLDNYYSFMKVVAMSYQACLGQNSEMSLGTSFSQKHADRKDSFMGMSNAGSMPMSSNVKKDYTYDG